MISVEMALDRIFDLVAPVGTEDVSILEGADRVLAEPVIATRDQPPFATSAMDGFAVRDADIHPGAGITVIGEAPAGHRFPGEVRPGTAVRIFTGGEVPPGADRILIQEDAEFDGSALTVRAQADSGTYIRPAGGDYRAGMRIAAPCLLRPSTVTLIASMGFARVTVARKPDIAIIPTGNELVMPGEDGGTDSIIASSGFGIAAILDECGARPRILPIARDREESIRAAFAMAGDADLIVTVGGASEGDYDLIRPVARKLGFRESFYKLAMRPGKPVMAGAIGDVPVVGLPGNPVSALVCSHVLLVPAVRTMLGLGRSALPRRQAPLLEPVPGNGNREHYMRATSAYRSRQRHLRVATRQDSSLMSVLDQADALVVRPPSDPPRKEGDIVEYCDLIKPFDTKNEHL